MTRFVVLMTALTCPAWGPPALALGAPPDVPPHLKVRPGQIVRVVVKTDKEIGSVKNFAETDAFWGELVSPAKGARHFMFQAPALEYDAKGKVIPPKRTEFVIGWWEKGDLSGSATTITLDLTGVAPVPPGPVPPSPDPTPPAPDPVSTFEVLLVYESGATHPPGVKAVLEGRVVEDWLTANCTGGKAGWGRRDKDFPPDQDRTALKAMWAAAQPRVTSVPCVAVAVNGKIRIDALKSTPAEQVAELTKLRGK